MILIRRQTEQVLHLESMIAMCDRLENAGKGTRIYLVKRMYGYLKTKGKRIQQD